MDLELQAARINSQSSSNEFDSKEIFSIDPASSNLQNFVSPKESSEVTFKTAKNRNKKMVMSVNLETSKDLTNKPSVMKIEEISSQGSQNDLDPVNIQKDKEIPN